MSPVLLKLWNYLNPIVFAGEALWERQSGAHVRVEVSEEETRGGTQTTGPSLLRKTDSSLFQLSFYHQVNTFSTLSN